MEVSDAKIGFSVLMGSILYSLFVSLMNKFTFSTAIFNVLLPTFIVAMASVLLIKTYLIKKALAKAILTGGIVTSLVSVFALTPFMQVQTTVLLFPAVLIESLILTALLIGSLYTIETQFRSSCSISKSRC
jgi:hypothetical protein